MKGTRVSGDSWRVSGDSWNAALLFARVRRGVALSFRDQLSRSGGLSSASTKRRVDASINSGLFIKPGLAATAVKADVGGFGSEFIEKEMQLPSYSSRHLPHFLRWEGKVSSGRPSAGRLFLSSSAFPGNIVISQPWPFRLRQDGHSVKNVKPVRPRKVVD
jgi:hypothetical protein